MALWSWISGRFGRLGAVRASAELTIGTPASPIDWEPYLSSAFTAGASGWFGSIPRHLALKVPAVRRGLNVYGVIGTFPLVRWRDGERIEPGPLLTQPEAWCPPAVTLAATVRDLVLYPYAWWMVTERQWTGYPAKVQRLDPEYVQVETVPGAEGEPARVFATYMGEQVNEADLIRFDGPDEGLLALAQDEILTALTLEAAARRYASPEVPTGAITGTGQYVLTNDEVDELLANWRKARATGNTAYLANATYQTLASNPTELQLVEAREETALQLSRQLGLPPRYVNATVPGDSMTYSNVSSERLDLVDLSFAPYIAAIVGRLSMSDRNGCPAGQTVSFDMNAFLRGAPLDRATRDSILIPLGVMSPDEARAAEPDLSGPAPAPPAAAAAPALPAPAEEASP